MTTSGITAEPRRWWRLQAIAIRYSCRGAGFHEGDWAPVVACRGVPFIRDGSQRRLLEDLTTIHEEQVRR